MKQTLIIWKEGIRAMVYVFKPTDMLVRAQVTLFMLGVNETIEDVPPMYNLREAVLEAMGMSAPEELEDNE